MAASPLGFLAVILITTTFNGLLFGSELASSSFDTPSETGCSGFFDSIGCIFRAIWGGIVLVFKVMAIVIPGAPWYVQVPLSSFTFAGYAWSFITLLRGN